MVRFDANLPLSESDSDLEEADELEAAGFAPKLFAKVTREDAARAEAEAELQPLNLHARLGLDAQQLHVMSEYLAEDGESPEEEMEMYPDDVDEGMQEEGGDGYPGTTASVPWGFVVPAAAMGGSYSGFVPAPQSLAMPLKARSRGADLGLSRESMAEAPGRPVIRQASSGFRVGWGPAGTLVTTNGTLLAVHRVHMESPSPEMSPEAYKAQIVAALEKHRAHYARHGQGTGANDHLASLSDSYASSERGAVTAQQEKAQSLWRLVKLLACDEFGARAHPASAYEESYARRMALSRWLEQTLRGGVEAEVAGTTQAGAIILALLAGHRVPEACEAAIGESDFRLATLLAQAGEDATTRGDLKAQVEAWRESGAWELIETEYQDIYRLLSGDVTVQEDRFPVMPGHSTSPM
jgi:nuclear pore complex protein Nup98-Nup96